METFGAFQKPVTQSIGTCFFVFLLSRMSIAAWDIPSSKAESDYVKKEMPSCNREISRAIVPYPPITPVIKRRILLDSKIL